MKTTKPRGEKKEKETVNEKDAKVTKKKESSRNENVKTDVEKLHMQRWQDKKSKKGNDGGEEGKMKQNERVKERKQEREKKKE